MFLSESQWAQLWIIVLQTSVIVAQLLAVSVYVTFPKLVEVKVNQGGNRRSNFHSFCVWCNSISAPLNFLMNDKSELIPTAPSFLNAPEILRNTGTVCDRGVESTRSFDEFRYYLWIQCFFFNNVDKYVFNTSKSSDLRSSFG